MKGYFNSRVFSLDPKTQETQPDMLKKHIASELRRKFDDDSERADAEAQFNRLCDVLENM